MAYVIQVNPIDLELNVALGLDLPMATLAGTGFQQNYFTIDQALANAKNLLRTEPGERIMLPQFGCGLRRTLFEQLTEEAVDALNTRILQSFATFLPYIFIKELIITPKPDENKLLVQLSISLNENGFDERAILIEVSNG
jgi:phage baseplate assembly protein W